MPPVLSILRFPVEVTQNILFKAMEPELFDWTRVADRRFELCFVCTQWRDVIYAASEFWGHVPVMRGHSPAMLAFVLERAKNRPLSVFILTWNFELSKRPSGFKLPVCLVSIADFIVNILGVLEPAYERVQYLTLNCGTLEAWRVLWGIICTKALPMLKRLSITMQQPVVTATRSFLYESFPDMSVPFKLQNCLVLKMLVVAWPIDAAQREVLFPVHTRPFAIGFALVVKKHTRSLEVTVWKDRHNDGTPELLRYTGASVAHQWAAKEKRPLLTL
ncbi:hypothetical protein C8R45DRAFT_1097452 [Mycena sanguinolenta]|nr:hypothetical protein C8R45DRAFT_1097452 [Mycena sanguinolenta]